SHRHKVGGTRRSATWPVPIPEATARPKPAAWPAIASMLLRNKETLRRASRRGAALGWSDWREGAVSCRLLINRWRMTTGSGGELHQSGGVKPVDSIVLGEMAGQGAQISVRGDPIGRGAYFGSIDRAMRDRCARTQQRVNPLGSLLGFE